MNAELQRWRGIDKSVRWLLHGGRTKIAIHLLFSKYLRLPKAFDEIPEEIDKQSCLATPGGIDLTKDTLQKKIYDETVK